MAKAPASKPASFADRETGNARIADHNRIITLTPLQPSFISIENPLTGDCIIMFETRAWPPKKWITAAEACTKARENPSIAGRVHGANKIANWTKAATAKTIRKRTGLIAVGAWGDRFAITSGTERR